MKRKRTSECFLKSTKHSWRCGGVIDPRTVDCESWENSEGGPGGTEADNSLGHGLRNSGRRRADRTIVCGGWPKAKIRLQELNVNSPTLKWPFPGTRKIVLFAVPVWATFTVRQTPWRMAWISGALFPPRTNLNHTQVQPLCPLSGCLREGSTPDVLYVVHPCTHGGGALLSFTSTRSKSTGLGSTRTTVRKHGAQNVANRWAMTATFPFTDCYHSFFFVTLHKMSHKMALNAIH